MKRLASLVAVSLLFVSGCGKNYEDFQPGEFQGRLVVEWYDPDRFIFRPVKEDPLVFTRFDNTSIEPQIFQTDGGSIPRIFRAFKHYSPWGYAKAYIMHDWLFAEHHCGRLEDVSFEDSADILSEGVRTMIEERGEVDPTERKVLETIDAAVRTSIARNEWDNGTCDPVDDTGQEASILGRPRAVFVIE